MAETKGEAFQRLAERRTNAILDRIRVLGNLSNPYAYEYSDEDVRLIFVANRARAQAHPHEVPEPPAEAVKAQARGGRHLI